MALAIHPDTQWDHILAESTWQLQHQLRVFKYPTRSRTFWGHGHHHISGIHSNTKQHHILADGRSTPQHQWSSFKYWTQSHTFWEHIMLQYQWSSFKYWMRSHTCWGDMDTITSVKFIVNTGWDHIHTEGTWMPPHQWVHFKYWTTSHTCWGYMDTTLVEFIQTLNKITYSLSAHWCHNVSRVHSNTGQDHILPEGTSILPSQPSSLKYLMRLHTC